jgi:hypothetical protein
MNRLPAPNPAKLAERAHRRLSADEPNGCHAGVRRRHAGFEGSGMIGAVMPGIG